MPATKGNERKNDDIVIACLGPTGAGKSRFIDALLGTPDNSPARKAGDRLQSVTDTVSATRVRDPTNPIRNQVVLVDTPGFDDTNRSDMEILRMIGDWMKKEYQKGKQLAAIIYFHRITDVRMAGSPHRNFRIFAELCGVDASAHVILVTTMWDLPTERAPLSRFEEREKELRESFWKVMLQNKATMARFDNKQATAWSIVMPFVDKYLGKILLLQKELVDEKLRLNETRAGRTIRADMLQFIADTRKQLDVLRPVVANAGDNSASAKSLRAMEESLAAMEARVESVKVSFFRRIILFFNPKPPHASPLRPEDSAIPP